MVAPIGFLDEDTPIHVEKKNHGILTTTRINRFIRVGEELRQVELCGVNFAGFQGGKLHSFF
jgi:hypothetical protein